MAAAGVASVILFAAILTPAPVRITPDDLVGMWGTVRGDCSRGQHLLSENELQEIVLDSISEGDWFLSGSNKIILSTIHKNRCGDPRNCTIRTIL